MTKRNIKYTKRDTAEADGVPFLVPEVLQHDGGRGIQADQHHCGIHGGMHEHIDYDSPGLLISEAEEKTDDKIDEQISEILMHGGEDQRTDRCRKNEPHFPA